MNSCRPVARKDKNVKKSITLAVVLLTLLSTLVNINLLGYSKSSITASQIDAFLASQGSPMVGEGEHYLKWGEYFNVDPRLVVAISGAESTFGKYPCGNNFNVWGWMYGGSCWDGFAPNWDHDANQTRFADAPGYVAGQGIYMETGYEDGIFWVTGDLRRHYLNEGLNTVAKVGNKWCQSGCANWEPNVTSFLNEMGGDPGDLDFGGTQRDPSVPFFSQRDSRWSSDQMGSSSCTIGTCGCAMTDVAMILSHSGSDATPKKLNTWLGLHGGYTAYGAIYWDVADEYDGSGGVVFRGLNGLTDNWSELSTQLAQGRLVIVKVDAYSGQSGIQSHWVLVTEKVGSSSTSPSSYSINDPYDRSYIPKTLAHYSHSGATFYAMRYYSGSFGSVSPPLPPIPTSPGTSSRPGPVINTLTQARTLKWNGSSGADHYALAISKYPYGSSNIVYNPQVLYGTSVTVPSGVLEYGQKYRWNMQACNSAGPSAVSNTLYFQTPTPTCTYTISPTSRSFGASGGTGSFTVTTSRSDCQWSASKDAYWITITSGGDGPGSKTLHYRVAANTGNQRTGHITVQGHQYTINQAASTTCTYSISPTSQSFDPSGGTGSFTVTTSRSDCQWSASKDAYWITITSGGDGPGSKTLHYRVAANTGNQRTGHITVQGHQYTVNQAAPTTCTYTISPTSQSFNASGGTGSFTVTTSRSDCQWSASKDAYWITITSGGDGPGSKTLHYRVAANTGTQRTGHITVQGHQYTVNQAAPTTCTYTISPTSQSFNASGGTGSFTVTTSRSDCQWSASKDAYWITITSGGDGPGSKTLHYRVAANTGTQRTGHITVQGHQYTVNQAAPTTCTYTISPTSQSFGASGGSGSFDVIASRSDCWWMNTLETDANWITITGRTTATPYGGDGTVEYTVSANSGPARTGHITVEGLQYTISQAALTTCTYSISPSGKSFDYSGGSGSFNVTTSRSDCAWTAQLNNNVPFHWITITSGKNGTGNGTVHYTVSANSVAARTGHITVEGQQYTISQTALTTCTYSISPTSRHFGHDGGTGTFSVTTARPDCAWMAGSTEGWIILAPESYGTGSGIVHYAVAPNSGNERTGYITIEGKMHRVTQDSTGDGELFDTHTYGAVAGWYMISVPLSNVAASLYGTTAWHWNSATGAYIAATTIEPGRGYWVKLPANKSITVTGAPITTDVTINVATADWHMISAPWSYPRDDIQVIRGAVTKSWPEAVAAGWVRGDIYGYKATDGAYTTPTTINPWYGYWMRPEVSGLSLRLLYATPQAPPPPAAAPRVVVVPADLPPLPPALSADAVVEGLVFCNFPNPITDVHTTTFAVTGPMATFVEAVKVQIFDLSGRLVYERETAGTSLDWHTNNMYGEYLANGVYLYIMYAKIDGEWAVSEVKKLVILR